MGASGYLISLEGSPRDVGAAFGNANAEDIRDDVKRFFKEAKEHEGFTARQLTRSGKSYAALIERYAPHWLEEAEGLARAAGVDAERYITCQGAKYRGINRPECFTWYTPPAWNRDKVGLFHKNRDNKRRTQCAYVKAVKVPGKRTYRFMAGGDTMAMGTMFGVNERGLAIAADTGEPDPHPLWHGMMNTDTMRLMLERCGDMDEVLAFLKRLQADRVCAGGKLATNWMFADARGRSLRVNQFVKRLVVKRGGRSCLVMRDADPRGEIVSDEMRKRKGNLTAMDMNRLARRKPVLHKTNCSSFTAAIPERQCGMFTCAWFAVAHAAETVYVPLYMGVSATPSMLVNGKLSNLSMAATIGKSLGVPAGKAGVDSVAF
ncbi:MAG: C45 family autoproteolytic acyltransferase/hydrolase, partial [Candidatus Hydrogenedentes bacterium]|nr:C45 family autoproteolytic acyltransferase/hydrolase [Candidatus Hydrogenedentota bacterium]